MFRNQRFNILTFLLLFAFLYYSYVVFVGIISPGGKWYSSFLDRYANVPAWLTYGICSAARSLLQLAGYDTFQKAPNNISIRGSHGVNIIWACLGFGVMSFWTAFVAAHRAGWLYKAKWIAIGLASIIALNIIRIASIPLAFYHHWKSYTDIEVHFFFTVASYIVILGITALFIYRYNQRYGASGKVEAKPKQAVL